MFSPSLESEQTPLIEISPIQAVIWCHRVRIALAQAMAEYTLYNVDLDNKPDWFSEKVNPTGKVRSSVCHPRAYTHLVICILLVTPHKPTLHEFSPTTPPFSS